jgi:two-component system, NarL family, nitrate/nitrite response regulator NarL
MTQASMPKIRILLLDDHTLFRDGLSRLLDSEPDFEITANCSSVPEALEIVRRQPIDIVLLDYDLGEETGSDFLVRAREAGYSGRLLMLTAGMSGADSVEVVRSGVSGIFLKHNSPTLLCEAIHKVMSGEAWLDKRQMQILAQAAAPVEQQPAQRPLTDREREVLRGVFEGSGNKEIAAKLGVSESSVKASLQHLFHKTGVRTRSQLVRIALERYAGQWKC